MMFIKLLHRSALMLLVFLLPALAAHGDVAVIHAGQLITEVGEPIKPEQTLVVRNGVIERIEEGFITADTVEAGARFIDLSTQYVMPGLIDMHVHLLIESDPERKLRLLTESDSLLLLRGARNARVTLQSGFTTVRDLGADPESIYALRDGIAAGLIQGPRVVAVGSPVAATGGHGDVDGLRPELLAAWTPETICDGVEACRKTVRHAIKFGADWIKVTATGGVMSDTGTGLEVQMTDDELAEIVTTAHSLGIKVAMHAHGTSGILAALRAGADTIEHGSFQTDESVKLHKKTGAYFVPTLMPGFFILPRLQNNPVFSDAMRSKAQAAGTAIQESFALALKRDINIAFGTDTGVTPHGMNAKEFELMVKAGMSAEQAIASTTTVAAQALDMEAEIGSLAVGKQADLIGVANNPFTDVTELQRVVSVVKGGRVAK